MRKLAEAVAYAHSQGIVHRDIKPHNVMIDSTGEPQLMDFGLAKRTDDSSNLTTDGALLGTPAYMSPEQARGELQLVNELSDQYSLGVVLYHLLTGATPCEGSPHMVIAEVAKGEFHSARDWNTNIDRTLDAICQKAMHPEQAQRYTDCSQFAEDLDAWSEGKPILARQQSAVERGLHFIRKHSLAATLFSIILGLAVSLAFFSWHAVNGNGPQLTTSVLNEEELPKSEKSTPASELACKTDLLALIDVDNCTLDGAAHFEGTHLMLGQDSAGSIKKQSRVEVPYALPREYQLRITASRIHTEQDDQKPGGLLVTVPVGDTTTSIQLDGVFGSGISRLRGVEYRDNPTRVITPAAFSSAKPSEVIVDVMRDAIRVFVNGEQLIEAPGDPAAHSSNWGQRHPNHNALALKIDQSSFSVSSVVLHSDEPGTPILPPRINTATAALRAREIFGNAVSNVKLLADRIGGHVQVESNTRGEQRIRFNAQHNGLKWKSLQDEDLVVLGKLEGPVSISLEYTRGWSAKGIAALANLERLEILGLRHCSHFTDEMLQLLPTNELRNLGVERSQVTDKSTEHIVAMNKLDYLKINETKVGDGLLKSLSKLPLLEHLWIGGEEISDAGMITLCTNKNLKDIRIYNGRHGTSLRLTRKTLDALETLPKLSTLYLERPKMTAEEVREFQEANPDVKLHFTELKTNDSASKILEAASSVNTTESIPEETSNSKSTSAPVTYRSLVKRLIDAGVYLTAVFVDGEAPKRIDRNTGIPDFDFKPVGMGVLNKSITAESLEGLEKLETIKMVELQSSRWTGEHLRHLPKSVTRIGLFGCKLITDASLLEIPRFENLGRLDLRGTSISSSGLSVLAGCHSVSDLSLVETNVDDTAIEHLKRMKNLTRLRLDETGISDQGVETLKMALPKCTIIAGD